MMFAQRPALVLWLMFAVGIGSNAAGQQDSKVALKLTDEQVDVTVGGKPFTTLHYGRDQKPILYPVLGPGQVGMTRNWPVKDEVEGEAHDHPHHQSVWFGHEVNGIDFWAHRSGVVKVREVTLSTKNFVELQNDWLRKNDRKKILSDQSIYRFGGDEQGRWIDLTITLKAGAEPVVLEDTKEGCFAVRTHPDLRLTADPQRGVEQVFGNALNSAGDRGKQLWGKAAKWVLYYGKIDDQEMAIAMYDHPDNLRHPTTWHARDYGLVAANPFGLHYFSGKEAGAGEYRIDPGQSLTLRYRADFLKGNPTAEQIEERYQAFAESE
jgi:hypothetical protein